METNTNSIKISLSTGTLEISGEKDFVNTQLDKWMPIYESMAKQPRKEPLKPDEILSTSDRGPIVFTDTANLIGFPSVFAINNENVEVIAQITGTSIKEKAINTAVLAAFGNKKLGKEEISGHLIKEACKRQACLDAKNHATYMKSASSYFTTRKSNGDTIYRLTVPGERFALKLATDLENAN